MKGFNFKKWIPHIVAIVVFACLTIAYFSPVIFDNKDLHQGDVTSSIGWGNDLREYHKQTGEYAFWSNAMFGGMPANYAFMPPSKNIFESFAKPLMLYLPPLHVGLVFLYLIGFYIFLLALGANPWLSIVGAIAYALATYNIVIIDAGHVNKGYVMATMAPILGGIILCYRKKIILGSLITLFFTGMNVAWSHQQISYYLLMMILTIAVVYFIYAIREKTLKDFFKASGVLLIIATIAVLPAVDRLIPTADYTKETMRGGAVLKNNSEGKKETSGLDIDYAYMWSYGKMESFSFLIPNIYGGSSAYDLGRDSKTYEVLKQTGQAESFTKNAPAYWGDQPGTSGPVYIGAIICFLFVLGFFIIKGPEVWWIAITTVIALILSWGKNLEGLNEFLFHYLPLYNKFRTPSMALVIAEVSMVTMAILALKKFIETDNKKMLLKPIYKATGITAGLALVFALFGGAFFSFTSEMDTQYQFPGWLIEALQEDRKSLLTFDAWRSFFLILMAVGLLWLHMKKKLHQTAFIVTLGILIVVDLWSVDRRFLGNDNFLPKRTAKAIVPTEADKLILTDKDPNYRVLNLASNTFNESRTSYFHKSIGGYSPAKFRRYQDIIDYHLSGRGLNLKVLNMLNTKYIIVPDEKGGQAVQRNSEALGNAWFVDTIQWVNSPDEEIAALSTFNPASTAVIDKVWKNNVQQTPVTPNNGAKIQMTGYSPKKLTYVSESATDKLAVFSEVYYKTWRAYVDGKEVKPIRVNYILRGLEVPAGKHQIEFECIDELYVKSAKASTWGSVLAGIVLVSLLIGLYLENKKKSNA